MVFGRKFISLILLFIFLATFSSCSTLRKKKCNCPQWSQANEIITEIRLFDEPAA
jgi:hypothetical protein